MRVFPYANFDIKKNSTGRVKLSSPILAEPTLKTHNSLMA
jgi:hypothetical protein